MINADNVIFVGSLKFCYPGNCRKTNPSIILKNTLNRKDVRRNETRDTYTTPTAIADRRGMVVVKGREGMQLEQNDFIKEIGKSKE